MAIQRALCPVLVGREQELTTLEDALLAANRGEGQIVVLAGEAGVGKTRLATELQRRALKVRMAALWGGCSEAELALPYLPFLEAIGNYLRSVDLQRLRDRLGPPRRELSLLFPQIESERLPADDSESVQAKLRLFEAVLTLLNVPADDQGLLLVIEDLHWADASTRELLDYMTRRLRNTRILALVTYRSDELHRKHPLLPMVQGWRRTQGAQVVELAPLPREGVAQMVSAIFDEPTRDDTRDFLHRRCEGNPFVLEELLKTALDRGDVFRTPTGWARKALSEMKLPDTVRDTILLRLDRLQPEQVDVLRAAAVLGASFEDETLIAMTARNAETVESALQNCVQQQLLEADAGSPGRFRFRHALTREAIYGDLIATQRQRLHARAADVLAKRPTSRPIDLCHHLLAAKRYGEAVPMALTAAEQAEKAWALREAGDLYERVLPYVTQPTQRAALLCRLGNARWLPGDPATAQGYLEEGVQLLEQAGELRQAARYRLILGRCYWEGRRPDRARAEYERARDALEPAGPSEDLATAYVRLAGLHNFNFEMDHGRQVAQLAIETASAVGADAPRIWAYNFLGMALGRLGEVDAGMAYVDRSYEEAATRGLYYIAWNALYNGVVLRIGNLRVGEALVRLELARSLPVEQHAARAFLEGLAQYALGELDAALGVLRRGVREARQTAQDKMATNCELELAFVLGQLDRLDEALDLLKRQGGYLEAQNRWRLTQASMMINLDSGRPEAALAEVPAVLEVSHWPAVARLHLCNPAVEVLLAAGRLDEAEKVAALTRTAGMSGRPEQLAMEGRLALARGESERAIASLAEAAEIWAQAGYKNDESRTRRALARALALKGDRSGAERQLRSVLAAAIERGAAFEARMAREQLGELGIQLEAAESVQPTPSAIPTGERLVTVMFVDVRGYTAMTAKEAPHEMTEKLTTFMRWSRQEVERHHGLVDQYAGDALLATFNVSGVRLDHALHALQAAIAIRDKAGYAGLPVGIGIAVGPAIVGQLTTGANVTAVGETTNLASRLQAQAAAGEILLSEEAFRRVRSWLESQNLAIEDETLNLKGLAQPVATHRVRAPARTVH